MVGRKIEIIGSSRTDAGVHAIDQIANFKISEKMTESEIKTYLDDSLPQDISITSVEEVPERFHARYNAKDKTYVYKIWNAEHPNPLVRKYSMHVEEKLDLSRREKSEQLLC